MSASIIPLGEARLSRCAAPLRRSVEAEVDVLARRYAPDGRAEAFEAIAGLLETHAKFMGDGRAHVQLWAAAFRMRAALARGHGRRLGNAGAPGTGRASPEPSS